MKTLACRVNKDGSIDNFSIWNRKLSKEDLNCLYENDYNYHKFFRWNWQLYFLMNRNVCEVIKLFKPMIIY